MSDQVFTPEEVSNLQRYQGEGCMHPFTCPNRSDHPCNCQDLVPTTRGWICQICDYTQDWAHPFMKEWKDDEYKKLYGDKDG